MVNLANVFGLLSKKSKKNSIFCIENIKTMIYNYAMIKMYNGIGVKKQRCFFLKLQIKITY